MTPSLAPEEGSAASPSAAVSKNADAENRSSVASPVRHMHPDVAELHLASGTTPRRRRRKRPVSAPAAAEARRRARYDCAFQEEAPADAEDGGFAPPQLVWAKVLGYPWWPGQVFDLADASEVALREKRRRDAVLVAFLGDTSFVWAKAEDLLPFRDGFARLADIGGRSSSKSSFAPALDDALDEVSRRVDAGLSCGCVAAARMKQVVKNSGVRKDAQGAAADAAFARDAFRGEAFVRYIRALALAPEAGADRLDLAVAGAQMKAFRRWGSAANPAQDTTAGVDEVGNAAVVVAARAGRGRATNSRRAPSGDPTLSMCARAAAAAAANVAFMRHMFPGEAVEEYASATAVTPPPTGAYRRVDLAVATKPQRKAFDEWRSAANGNAVVDAATPPPGRRASPAASTPYRTVTSCISSGGDSPCENDGDGAWETDSEDFEPASEWALGWKDYVIVVQFLAIVMLLCRLME